MNDFGLLCVFFFVGVGFAELYHWFYQKLERQKQYRFSKNG